MVTKLDYTVSFKKKAKQNMVASGRGRTVLHKHIQKRNVETHECLRKCGVVRSLEEICRPPSHPLWTQANSLILAEWKWLLRRKAPKYRRFHTVLLPLLLLLTHPFFFLCEPSITRAGILCSDSSRAGHIAPRHS